MDTNVVILVTGASSGLGKATATLLSRSGYIVYGTSRRQSGVDGIRMLQLDVRDEASVKECVDEVIKDAGRIDVLVNNAGSMIMGPLEGTTADDAMELFDTNLFGTMRMVNAVLPSMRSRGSGKIVNMGSLSGTLPMPFLGAYSATKAAIFAYSSSLRHELMRMGIWVSVVEPGFFDTGILERTGRGSGKAFGYADIEEKVLLKMRKALRNGNDPKLVARAVLGIVRSRSPRLRYQVGKEKVYAALKRAVPDGVFDSMYRKYWGLGK